MRASREAPAPGEDLVTMLADEQAHIRRRAALATGACGQPRRWAPLSAMLATEADPEVRQMAAFALGLIGDARGGAGPDGGARLARSHAAGTCRRGARDAMGTRRGAGPIAAMMSAHIAAGVLDGLAADDVGYPKAHPVEAVRLGAYALVKPRGLRQPGVDAARSGRAAAERVVAGGVRVSARGRSEGGGSVDGVAEGRRAGDARVRGPRARGPQACAGPSRAGGPGARRGQPAAVRVQAIRALGALGEAADAPTLIKLLTLPDVGPALQLEAVTALGQLGNPAAVDVLLDLVSVSSPAMRAAALVALARVDAEVFVTAISGLDADPHWSVRAGLASALAELPAERAEARLTDLLKDQDQRVIPAVLSALATTGARSAAGVLERRLTAEDPVVRMAGRTSTPSKGTIQIELAVLDAPRTVANFMRSRAAASSTGSRAPGGARLRGAGRRPARRREGGPGTRFATRSTSGRTCAARWAWRSTGPTPAAASSSSRTRRSRTSTRATRSSGTWCRGWMSWIGCSRGT
jgi:HEAT repeat protein